MECCVSSEIASVSLVIGILGVYVLCSCDVVGKPVGVSILNSVVKFGLPSCYP